MAPDHYRCHKVCIPSTRAERISGSVKFFPHKTPIPHHSTIDEAVLIANKLINTLSSPDVQSLFESNNDTATALCTLSSIFLTKLNKFATQSTARAPSNPNTMQQLPRVGNTSKALFPRVNKDTITDKIKQKFIRESLRAHRARIDQE